MIYTKTINTVKNTAYSDRLKTTLEVTYGLVYRLEFAFPPGPAGLLHCQLFDGHYQIAPATPEETFHGDNALIGFNDMYMKQEPPYTFQIVTWNLDDTYDHSLQVRIGMVKEKAYMSRFMPSVSWDKFAEALQEITQSQEVEKQRQLREGVERVTLK